MVIGNESQVRALEIVKILEKKYFSKCSAKYYAIGKSPSFHTKVLN